MTSRNGLRTRSGDPRSRGSWALAALLLFALAGLSLDTTPRDSDGSEAGSPRAALSAQVTSAIAP